MKERCWRETRSNFVPLPRQPREMGAADPDNQHDSSGSVLHQRDTEERSESATRKASEHTMSEKPKLVSITMKWDDGSSLTYAPSKLDTIDKLIIEMMLEAAGVK